MNVAELLLQNGRELRDVKAFVQPPSSQIFSRERTITFGDFDLASAACARWLRWKRIDRGERVLVMIPVSIDLYIAITALLRTGAVAMFLDPSGGREYVRDCCKSAPPAALLGPARSQLLRVLHPPLRRVRSLVYPKPWRTGYNTMRPDIPAEVNQSDGLAPCDPGTPALLTFTSGSTATPKATVRTHGLLTAQQAALAKAIHLQPGQVDLVTLPMFALANLAAGVTSVLADADLRRPGFVNPAPVLAQIDRHQITRAAASPALFNRLAERCEATGRTLAPLRTLYTGGAPVYPRLLDRLDRLMPSRTVTKDWSKGSQPPNGPVTLYGSTEAEPIAHVAYRNLSPADREAMRAGSGLLVGEPVSQITLRIIDPAFLSMKTKPFAERSLVNRSAEGISTEAFESARCAPDTPGEIVVTGDHVIKGYLNPADDAETKLRVGDTTWHRTGDAGYLDASGRLWLLGRITAVAPADRHHREPMYPFAVECVAMESQRVSRAAAVVVRGQRVLAVELTPETPEAELLGAMHNRFADLIDRVLVLPEGIPLDDRHNAKVRYPQLRQAINAKMGGAASALEPETSCN